tara:strand:- start:302 stop:472 length:171 start_codon:yes stop_codon:yes gene_type:complete
LSELKKWKKIERKVGHPLLMTLRPKISSGKVPEMLKSLAYQNNVYPSRVIGIPSGK